MRPEHPEGRAVNVRVPRRLAAVRRSRHATHVREERPRNRAVRLHGLGVEAGRQEQQPQQVWAAEGVRDAARHRHLHAAHHFRGQAQDRPLFRSRQDPGVPRHRPRHRLGRRDPLCLATRHRGLQDQPAERQSPRQRLLLPHRRQRPGSHTAGPVLQEREHLRQRRRGTDGQEGRQAVPDREHRQAAARRLLRAVQRDEL